MALQFSNIKVQLAGTQKRVSGNVTFDSSYATGGEAFAPADIGLYAIADLDVRPAGTTATSAFILAWNQSTVAPKIKAFQGDNTNVAAAPAIEVPASTNLAALVASFDAWGS